MRKVKRLPEVSTEMRLRAQELRREATNVERKLWKNIRARQLGVFFHRQRVVGPYICDFVSLEGNLIVEADGSQHFLETGKVRDKMRNEYLKSLGFKVLRFSNRDVMNNIEGVLEVIVEHLR